MAGVSTSAVIAVTDVNLDHVYPAPLRYHIDVVMNSKTFFETLLSFHSAMGTRFMNPVIGGAQLDLYLLYFLVTQRGGIEKAIFDGKWREVIAELNIPSTVTNRSFVVKKHYFKLLFHYEQVYYFRREGPIIVPSVILHPRGHRSRQFVNNSRLIINEAMPLLPQPVIDQGSESSGSVPHHLAFGGSQPETVAPLPENEEGNDVAGSGPAPASVTTSFPLNADGNRIATSGDVPSDPTLRMDAPNEAQSLPRNKDSHVIGENMPSGERLEHNNLVTVTLGSQVFHGILHTQPLSAPNFSAFSFSGPPDAIARPKPCRSAYNIFFEEKYSGIRNLSPHGTREFFKLIEESWDMLTEDEKVLYKDQERMDKERYKRELQQYRERIRLMQSK